MNKLNVLLAAVCFAFVGGLGENAFAAGKKGALPRFAEVDQHLVYRGAQPTNEGIDLLAKMKVKTVISLRNERDDQIHDEEEYVRKQGMGFVSVPLNGISTPRDSDIEKVLRIMADPKAQPVFVHCMQGQDRTGLVVALYRVFVQGWAPKDAYSEMMDLGFKKVLVKLKHYFEDKTGYRE